MTDNASNPPRANRAWIFLLTALALFALAGMWRTTMKMKVEAAGTAQFQSPKRGEAAKVVVEVREMSGDRAFTGKLLEKRSETLYKRTQTPVEVTFADPRTQVVMGKASDVRAGAVLHVTGMATADHSVRANQLVILTEYVTVSE